MKSVLFFAIVALTFSAQAYKTGTYTCSGEDLSVTYKIKDVVIGGVSAPHIEVIKTQGENVNVVKGFATQFANNAGAEMLGIGALKIELKDGRPGCAQ